MREVLVGDSAADAIRRHQPYIDHVYRVQYAPERTGQTYIDPATGERKPLTGDNPLYLSQSLHAGPLVPRHAGRDRGQDDRVAAALRLEHFIFQGRQPGMTLRHAVDSLEALAKVLPEVRVALRVQGDRSP